MCNIGTKGVVAAKNINSIKNKESVLYEDKKKDALKAQQESARPCSMQAQGCKSANLSFKNRVPQMLA